MKAIHVKSLSHTVKMIDLPKGVEHIYPYIGNGCTTFECPYIFATEDTIYVDEEGLFHETVGGFMIVNSKINPLLGNALIIGTDEEGGATDVKMTVEEVEKSIIWLTDEECEIWREHALNTPPQLIVFPTEKDV